ncbi:dihydrofolate reductase family protein [Actinotalea sp. K2]|uniref:dihydrofolate reductase family protein n=1 Tax=Actinotalea sp. K2 TaxID=2939438 RepID=UPI002016D262|nr:dihydrofolate reductase family protein [Actinotalea sp. K2]MCL3862229.1 dihydrofolate reductase family protein [Actinotalea sp. K2]
MSHPPPALEVLLPAGSGDPIGPDPAEARLSALYAYPGASGSGRWAWLRGNMISTVDGASTGADGRSGSINGPADLRVFTTLRALADVVLVGAGTVRSEGYRAPRTAPALVPGRGSRGQADHPALAVVTASGDLPPDLLADHPAPWVFTTQAAPHLADLRRRLPADRLHVHRDTVDLALVRHALAEGDHPRILTEGGPSLLAALLREGLVDELCLTTSPVLVGGPAPRILDGTDWYRPAVRASPTHLLHADGVLLARWLVTSD